MPARSRQSSRRRPSLEGLSLRELEARFAPGNGGVSPDILRQLGRDPRAGAQRLYRKLKREHDRARAERDRLEGLLHFERVLWRAGLARVAGVDEVGVGPMAGPLVAAAVVFPPGTAIDGVDDSKRLDRESREQLDRTIRERASAIALGIVEPDEIDRLNVYHAGLEAMRRAVSSLPDPPQHVLVDSRTIPDIAMPQNSFDKGDGINFSIACASIVAKVHRDGLMVELDGRYPGYGFASHKGYCTPGHQAAIRRLGPSPIHRRSYQFLRELGGAFGDLFYQLRDAADDLSTISELREWESRLDAARPRLAPPEIRKLRILAGRRWKRLRPRSR